MTQAFTRRIDRLEKAARQQMAVDERQSLERDLGFRCAVGNAAVLSFLIRYGNPRVGEPLATAMDRCSETDAWKRCCRRFR